MKRLRSSNKLEKEKIGVDMPIYTDTASGQKFVHIIDLKQRLNRRVDNSVSIDIIRRQQIPKDSAVQFESVQLPLDKQDVSGLATTTTLNNGAAGVNNNLAQTSFSPYASQNYRPESAFGNQKLNAIAIHKQYNNHLIQQQQQ